MPVFQTTADALCDGRPPRTARLSMSIYSCPPVFHARIPIDSKRLRYADWHGPSGLGIWGGGGGGWRGCALIDSSDFLAGPALGTDICRAFYQFRFKSGSLGGRHGVAPPAPPRSIGPSDPRMLARKEVFIVVRAATAARTFDMTKL